MQSNTPYMPYMFQVCRFNVDDLGAECTWQKDYGFDEGTPCILLKLNKVSIHGAVQCKSFSTPIVLLI